MTQQSVLIPRRCRSLVETAVLDTRVVLISCARQVGKTTLAKSNV
jgi:predicted AAA+ superfamily ATPase